jgi:hypothetical protein
MRYFLINVLRIKVFVYCMLPVSLFVPICFIRRLVYMTLLRMIPMRTCVGTAATCLVKYSTGVSKEGHKKFNGGNTAELEE